MSLTFNGSSPNGNKATIRSTNLQDYRKDENGYSVFTWRDDGSGVILWREQHEMAWEDAFKKATDWLNS